MKDDRNAYMPQMFPFANMQNMAQMGTLPTNMMMFPNYMNTNNNLDNRVSALEKKVKVLENRISRLETPYQNTNSQNYQNTQSGQMSYQTTQSNDNYNGEMYMM